MRLSEALDAVGRPVAYFPEAAKFLGGVKSGILFCQAFYWSERADKSGWFWKSQQEFADETGLTIEELRAARKVLAEKGILQSRYARIEHRLYFKIDRKRLDELWLLWLTRNGHIRNSQMAGGNLTAGDVGKVDIGSDPETTKQTTNISERSKVVSLEEWYDREFLPLYPLPHRDDQRGDALAELRKLGPDRREQIVEGLKRWSVSPKFSKDGGEFAPGPGTFLKDRFFERTPAAATNGKARAERPTLDELYGEKA